jgi:hypothetical protein
MNADKRRSDKIQMWGGQYWLQPPFQAAWSRDEIASELMKPPLELRMRRESVRLVP